ncbi:YeeE/YedE thiosulfate transporter family protein [Dongia soli]|uniref:YeeE/YedE thiosulfate transporter family protein n=1 Tax=Dongia soli TaxID=600628 RepID=A0ABU5EIW8_9PROT|nr:YeeE/YedE thiosulfate transporter family protein [Dongia soli]MDY0885889.1 YeeE/YedE thiosulfate transporter family protein [Dongia soli]
MCSGIPANMGTETMTRPLLTLLACVLAFWMGYSANQGSTCLVAASQELQQRRRPGLFVGFLAASAAAGLVAVPLAWSGAGGALAASVDISATVLVGAVAFGIGALINDACLLGSLSRLGDGEIRLLAMPVGLAVGLLLIDRIMIDRSPLRPSVLTAPSKFGAAVLGGFLIVAVLSQAYISRRTASRSGGRWPLGVAMLVLGLTGGALYAIAPVWNYVHLVQRSLPLTMAATREISILTVAASIAGAVTAALHQGRWRLQRPTLADIGKSFVGGALMGVGVALIPGGNNGLILAAIPALSPGGIVAYLLMTATIVLGLSVIARISRKSTTA